MALAEVRSARRQVRTWGFGALAVGVSFLFFVGSGAQHAQDGWYSPVSDSPAPRFIMSTVGMPLLLVFLFGIIFLAFDIRARDRAERMVEVLDCRPFSNVELLFGRVLGIVATACVPALVLIGLVQAFGTFGGALGLPTEPVQYASLVTYLFVDALPMFLAWTAIVVLLALVVRNRVLVGAAALGLLVAWTLWSQSQSLYLSHLVGPTFFGNLVSDLVPSIAEPSTVVHRLALVALAVGVLFAAAGLHPRLDSGTRSARFGVSAAFVAVGAATMTGLVIHARDGIETRSHWLAVHEAAATDVAADIEHMAGTVRIDPGRQLAIDVVMRLAPTPGAGGELAMSFNPGLEVEAVAIDGEATDATHRDGLLKVAVPTGDGSYELALRASGIPDPDFAYLDSAFDFARDSSGRRNVTLNLGRDASIYDADYVALTPGVHWLPSPGANIGRDDPGGRDYYTVDLTVEAPAGWLVAGPGRRQHDDDGRFRFNPRSPVPAVALFAAAFERRAIEIAGVELELLMSPRHLSNLAAFEDAAGALAERLRELIGEASGTGLEYPYRNLSFVETPATLRKSAGGWRMDTVQALPGILLMSERAFPTARFDVGFRRAERRGAGDVDDFKVNVLERYFRNDFAGGDPFVGFATNIMRFQTDVGNGGMSATALAFVVDRLVDLRLTGRAGFFSAHLFTPDHGTSLGRIGQAATRAFEIGGRSNSALDAVANRPVVWDLALATALADLDPENDPAGVLDTLALKGSAVAQSIFDALGNERTGMLLSELRRRHGGGHYDLDAFYEAAKTVGVDLRSLLGDWLNDAALPGFLASPARMVRLPDTARGGARFETRVHIRNDEPVPGLLRLRYATVRWIKTKGRGMMLSDPVRVPGNSAVEVALVTGSPVAQLSMAPYLALNRTDVRLAIETSDSPGAEGFSGVRPTSLERGKRLSLESTSDAVLSPSLVGPGARASDWLPPVEPGIVVDDLDEGFDVERRPRGNLFRFGNIVADPRRLQGEMDHGIPEYLLSKARGRTDVLFDGEWRRQGVPSSFGKYRRTVARASAGEGHARALFSTVLPGAGRWRLDYHMPAVQKAVKGRLRFRGQPKGLLVVQGEYDMTLEFGDGKAREIAFDATAAEQGWNDLGSFELPEGPVRLVVSNRTTGDVVLADAIRWRPVNDMRFDLATDTGEE